MVWTFQTQTQSTFALASDATSNTQSSSTTTQKPLSDVQPRNEVKDLPPINVNDTTSSCSSGSYVTALSRTLEEDSNCMYVDANDDVITPVFPWQWCAYLPHFNIRGNLRLLQMEYCSMSDVEVINDKTHLKRSSEIAWVWTERKNILLSISSGYTSWLIILEHSPFIFYFIEGICAICSGDWSW